EGGMGSVYEALRDEEFEQRVALKLVRRELGSSTGLRLFQAERQILARLEHPNIARLLDGGTAEDGAPYFVMELVEGRPIDRYCDDHRLTLRQRLELFLPVCAALSAAHQNLVVHRDLKPSNILVDVTGVPKLLDFGIAKLLEPAADGSLVTVTTRNLALTPRYASPEQLRGEAVGTTSDVYSLGVVLYQLLTGHLPCDVEQRDPVAAQVAICQEDPLPASAVIDQRSEGFGGETTTARTPESVSRARGSDPKSLRRKLSGDLDAILAKALRKAPSQRYGSVEALAADLRRHLAGHPVSARAGTTTYRVGRFLRRHRFGTTNTLLLLLLAVGFTTALLRQLDETRRSRDQAVEISSFLVDLFESASPDRPGGPEPSVRDLLDAGRAKLDGALGQEPAVRAGLLLRLGEVYSRLGDYDTAGDLLAEALVLLRRLHPDGDHDQATALSDLAVVRYHTGDRDAAEALLRESVGLRRMLGEPDDLIKPMNNLAAILLERGELGEAETIYRETLEMRRRLAAAAPGDVTARGNLATGLRSLAAVLQTAGDLDAAEPLLAESLDLRTEIYGADSPMVATVLLSLGRLDEARGRLPAAQARFARALDIRRRKLGEDHLHTALARRDLAAVEVALGQTASARAHLEAAVATLIRLRPAEDPDRLEAEALLESTRDAALPGSP
ncbi:MAG: serine/threonine protein kinase, partial [Acidobacteria bacterium]|nr:serine/threonine protein kinase [Acidobacteriota bacterium]